MFLIIICFNMFLISLILVIFILNFAPPKYAKMRNHGFTITDFKHADTGVDDIR